MGAFVSIFIALRGADAGCIDVVRSVDVSYIVDDGTNIEDVDMVLDVRPICTGVSTIRYTPLSSTLIRSGNIGSTWELGSSMVTLGITARVGIPLTFFVSLILNLSVKRV